MGIDEAGRGPWAGPVSVGVVVMPLLFKPALSKYSVKDSKKLSEKNREKWYQWLSQERHLGKINFATALVSEKFIDQKGIVPAVRLGIRRCLSRLELNPGQVKILLDGSLRAPKTFTNQQTIIRGDETEPIIALASIAAKVRRDRFMTKLAEQFPQYHFEIHKGYGTLAHYKALKKYGPSTVHRLSFLKKVVK